MDKSITVTEMIVFSIAPELQKVYSAKRADDLQKILNRDKEKEQALIETPASRK